MALYQDHGASTQDLLRSSETFLDALKINRRTSPLRSNSDYYVALVSVHIRIGGDMATPRPHPVRFRSAFLLLSSILH